MRAHLRAQGIPQSEGTKPNPNGIGIERPHEGIITLSRLERLVVGIDHDGNTGEQEEERHGPSILVVFLVLVVESEDSQEERQHEVRVARRIVFPVVRQVFLVAQSHAVQEWNTGDPVPFRDFIAVLLVVLTTAVVPHEITEPHFTYLVFKEEPYVLRKSDRRLRIFDVHDVDVVLAVLWIVVPNTREEALVLRIVVRHTSLFVVSQQVLTVDGEVAAIGRYIGFGLCLQLE